MAACFGAAGSIVFLQSDATIIILLRPASFIVKIFMQRSQVKGSLPLW
jgi:hypothetical protein